MTNPKDATAQEPSGSPLATHHDMKAALRENYLPVQYAYVQFFTEHLVDCRRSFGGDLDDVMLVAVLGQRMMSARLAPDQRSGEDAGRDWMSALRIADVTGIPRESVRRKLAGLAARGWVVNAPGQGWSLATPGGKVRASADLADLDARAIDRLARLVTAIQRIVLPDPDDQSPPGSLPGQ